VSDHGNAKVKALTEQFIDLLRSNGIHVHAEKYLTHQPGYQVRAAALNTPADFFFQIHSKTAGPGHVRLYIAGQPRRMTMEEAVANVWSSWRLQCGALSRDEVDLLSSEKIELLLRDFANVEGIDFTGLQRGARSIIEAGDDIGPLLDRLRELETILQDGKAMVVTAKLMGSEFPRQPGTLLTQCLPAPHSTGLSQPLRELLVSVIDQAIAKARAIGDCLQRYRSTSPGARFGDDGLQEIPIDGDIQSGDSSSWKMLIESLDEDHVGSMRIASYGDSRHSAELLQDSAMFMLDDYT
jgi:hypothetical protein